MHFINIIYSEVQYVCHRKLLRSFGRMTRICSCMRQSGTSFVFELEELQHWYCKLQLLLLSEQSVSLCHFHCGVPLLIQREMVSLTTSVQLYGSKRCRNFGGTVKNIEKLFLELTKKINYRLYSMVEYIYAYLQTLREKFKDFGSLPFANKPSICMN